MSGPYRRGRPARAPLTPPGELVGRLVKWSPRDAQGRRTAPVFGRCTAFDADARTLTVEVEQTVSAWQPNRTRTVVLPLSAGPFTAV